MSPPAKRRSLRTPEASGVPSVERVSRPLLALAASLALTLLLGWQLTRTTGLSSRTSPGGSTETEAARQLQFTTPGGTRVIWTLDPNFEI